MKQYREKIKMKSLKRRTIQRKKQRKIKECKSVICNCECGSSFRHCAKARHEKSNKHQKYLKSLQLLKLLQ